MQLNPTQIATFISDAASQACLIINQTIEQGNSFAKAHLGDLHYFLPENWTDTFPKEWAEAIPIALLSAAALYTIWQAVKACSKAISACAWVGVASITTTALVMAIKNSNLNPIK